jgi:hypothetical protein
MPVKTSKDFLFNANFCYESSSIYIYIYIRTVFAVILFFPRYVLDPVSCGKLSRYVHTSCETGTEITEERYEIINFPISVNSIITVYLAKKTKIIKFHLTQDSHMNNITHFLRHSRQAHNLKNSKNLIFIFTVLRTSNRTILPPECYP